ncbi:MAG: hypothetical protein R2710_22720 [Acidimicrobiales bacterium]
MTTTIEITSPASVETIRRRRDPAPALVLAPEEIQREQIRRQSDGDHERDRNGEQARHRRRTEALDHPNGGDHEVERAKGLDDRLWRVNRPRGRRERPCKPAHEQDHLRRSERTPQVPGPEQRRAEHELTRTDE